MFKCVTTKKTPKRKEKIFSLYKEIPVREDIEYQTLVNREYKFTKHEENLGIEEQRKEKIDFGDHRYKILIHLIKKREIEKLKIDIENSDLIEEKESTVNYFVNQTAKYWDYFLKRLFKPENKKNIDRNLVTLNIFDTSLPPIYRRRPFLLQKINSKIEYYRDFYEIIEIAIKNILEKDKNYETPEKELTFLGDLFNLTEMEKNFYEDLETGSVFLSEHKKLFETFKKEKFCIGKNSNVIFS